MKAIRKGFFAKVGDLVRNGWSYETKSIAPPYIYGLVIETQSRSPKSYTEQQIAERPIRMMKILTATGEIIRRYAVHVEVINESR